MAREVIILQCTESGDRSYTTYKNKTNSPERLELKKYNKFLRRHTLYREVKK